MNSARLLLSSFVLLTCGSASAQWSTLDLPTPRLGPAGTALGTRAFFAGGNPGPSASSESAVVDIYDELTGTWSLATLSRARVTVEAISVGSKAIFAGGFDGDYLNEVDIYDAATDTWSTASLAQYGWVQAASVGELVFFGGGRTASPLGSPITDTVSVYDSDANTWSTLQLSVPRGELGVAAVGSQVFFAGGLGPNGLSNVVDIYDVETGQWTSATLSQARSVMGCATVGSKVLFGGGFAFSGETARVDIYDAETGLWTTAQLSEARQTPAVAVVGPLVLFAGGQITFNVSDVVDIFDSRTGLWQTSQLSQERAQAGVAVLCNRVLLAGGGTPDAQDNVTIDVYTLPEALGQPLCQVSEVNSTGMPGSLCASGDGNAAGAGLSLYARNLPYGRFGVFIVGAGTANAPNFGGGAGTLCIAGPARYRQTGQVQAVGTDGALALAIDPTQTPVLGGVTAIAPGETWHFQCWYRDAGGTTNLTDGVSITFQ